LPRSRVPDEGDNNPALGENRRKDPIKGELEKQNGGGEKPASKDRLEAAVKTLKESNAASAEEAGGSVDGSRRRENLTKAVMS